MTRSLTPAVAGAILACAVLVPMAWPSWGVRGAEEQALGEAPDSETARAAITTIRRRLNSADAQVSDLRVGRSGILCGRVDVRNRMGTYTGARPFVFDPATGTAGRLPEGPELRNPSSMAEYGALERVRALFAAHCIDR